MKKFLRTNPHDSMPNNRETDTLQGYQSYPESEDIYIKFREEKNMDPEESNDDVFGGNLDVPGSELDDEQENVGNEDEENNYYSIGGDDHNNLDEDKDEL